MVTHQQLLSISLITPVYLWLDFTSHMLQEKNDHMVGSPRINQLLECIGALDLHFVSVIHLPRVILVIYPKDSKQKVQILRLLVESLRLKLS